MTLIAKSLRRGNPVDFGAINQVALVYLPALVRRWCPQGRMCGAEWVALNWKRGDRKPGSFCINTKTGRWADFACGAKGGDVISLAAYLFHTSQVQAARTLAAVLGVRP